MGRMECGEISPLLNMYVRISKVLYENVNINL